VAIHKSIRWRSRCQRRIETRILPTARSRISRSKAAPSSFSQKNGQTNFVQFLERRAIAVYGGTGKDLLPALRRIRAESAGALNFWPFFSLNSEKKYKELEKMVRNGYNVQILGFDGDEFLHDAPKTMRERFEDESQPFGHEFVIACCLLGQAPWKDWLRDQEGGGDSTAADASSSAASAAPAAQPRGEPPKKRRKVTKDE
jgi:hypothetical protein